MENLIREDMMEGPERTLSESTMRILRENYHTDECIKGNEGPE